MITSEENLSKKEYDSKKEKEDKNFRLLTIVILECFLHYLLLKPWQNYFINAFKLLLVKYSRNGRFYGLLK